MTESARSQALTGDTRVERFVAHLDDVTDGVEPRFFPVPSADSSLPGVTAIVYTDLPEAGLQTTFTYGLSCVGHEDWSKGRPELCLSVESTDLAWGIAAAAVGERLRGRCPFTYGDVINFGERISEESEMTGFLVFAPAVIDREDAIGIDVGDTLPVNIQGLYPIHESELDFIDEKGLEAFWQGFDFDPYDVRRPPVV